MTMSSLKGGGGRSNDGTLKRMNRSSLKVNCDTGVHASVVEYVCINFVRTRTASNLLEWSIFEAINQCQRHIYTH